MQIADPQEVLNYYRKQGDNERYHSVLASFVQLYGPKVPRPGTEWKRRDELMYDYAAHFVVALFLAPKEPSLASA